MLRPMLEASDLAVGMLWWREICFSVFLLHAFQNHMSMSRDGVASTRRIVCTASRDVCEPQAIGSSHSTSFVSKALSKI
eukprot:SAG31_NODE_21882_length_538_cov_1.633257_1_plen_79_part_00